MSSRKDLVAIPTLQEASQRINRFPESLKLVREFHDLGVTQLAESLGITRYQYYRYLNGESYPHHPVIMECVILWADKIRATLHSN